jgi:hypothetical protein
MTAQKLWIRCKILCSIRKPNPDSSVVWPVALSFYLLKLPWLPQTRMPSSSRIVNGGLTHMKSLSCSVRNLTDPCICTTKFTRESSNWKTSNCCIRDDSCLCVVRLNRWNKKYVCNEGRLSALENQKYGRRNLSRWLHENLFPQKLALALPTNGGRSVGIVRSRTKAMELLLLRSTYSPNDWKNPEHLALTFSRSTIVVSSHEALKIVFIWASCRKTPPETVLVNRHDLCFNQFLFLSLN